MNPRVLIRHVTGSKARTVEELAVVPRQEITFGRDAGCDVRYDEDRDEYVSRRHMKLVVDDPGGTAFTVVELSARNGTFVNRQRVRGPVGIKPGDVVQLGAGGPEFMFDVAAENLRETPVSGVPSLPLPAPEPLTASEPSTPAIAVKPPRRPAARRKAPRTHSAKRMIAGVLTLVVLVGAAVIYGMGGAPLKQAREAAQRLFAARAGSDAAGVPSRRLLRIENTWRVVDQEQGQELFQVYIPNRRSGTADVLAPGAGAALPVFVLLENNRLEPLLTFSGNERNQPVAGKENAAGFVLDSNLVLTTGSAAAPGQGPYRWPPGDSAGVVVVFDAAGKLARTAVIARRQFPRWVPAKAEFVIDGLLDGDTVSGHRSVATRVVSSPLVAGGNSDPAIAATVEAVSADGLATVRASVGGPGRAEIGQARDGEAVEALTASGMRPATLRESAGGRFAVQATNLSVEPGAPLLDSAGRVVAVQTPGGAAQPIQQVLEALRR